MALGDIKGELIADINKETKKVYLQTNIHGQPVLKTIF